MTDVVINTDYDPSQMQVNLFIAPSLPFLRRELEGLVRRFGIPVVGRVDLGQLSAVNVALRSLHPMEH